VACCHNRTIADHCRRGRQPHPKGVLRIVTANVSPTLANLTGPRARCPELRRVRSRHLGLLPAASAADGRCPGRAGELQAGCVMFMVACTNTSGRRGGPATSVAPLTTPGPARHNVDGQLKVGVLLPGSGPAADIGVSMKTGVQLAADEVNAAGGLAPSTGQRRRRGRRGERHHGGRVSAVPGDLDDGRQHVQGEHADAAGNEHGAATTGATPGPPTPPDSTGPSRRATPPLATPATFAETASRTATPAGSPFRRRLIRQQPDGDQAACGWPIRTRSGQSASQSKVARAVAAPGTDPSICRRGRRRSFRLAATRIGH
jgi:hypothetical protein